MVADYLSRLEMNFLCLIWRRQTGGEKKTHSAHCSGSLWLYRFVPVPIQDLTSVGAGQLCEIKALIRASSEVSMKEVKDQFKTLLHEILLLNTPVFCALSYLVVLLSVKWFGVKVRQEGKARRWRINVKVIFHLENNFNR